jgi:N-[(2S)-2-amino-2-carboxyethyl]-L-glutamate dehydrogenase
MSTNPLLYLDSAAVAKLLSAIDPLAVVTEALVAVGAGMAAVAPEAALRWTAPDGTAARSLILPARHEETYGCKIINACLGNRDRGLPRAQGLIVLYAADTAAPVCLMAAGLISALRTASVSLVALSAVRDLASVRRVAFLGAGRQAHTHLELLAARTDLAEVLVHDVDDGQARVFAAAAREFAPHARVRTAGPEEAVRAAEVTVAATTTTTPYVRLDWLPADAVFLNVSLDDAAEDVLMGCDHLLVDDWALVSEDTTRLLGRLSNAGRVTAPGTTAPRGGRAVDAELPAVVPGGYAAGRTGRVVVNPFGMGVHDIALAAQVHAAALAVGAGTPLPR